jgi:hypothetical protein
VVITWNHRGCGPRTRRVLDLPSGQEIGARAEPRGDEHRDDQQHQDRARLNRSLGEAIGDEGADSAGEFAAAPWR